MTDKKPIPTTSPANISKDGEKPDIAEILLKGNYISDEDNKKAQNFAKAGHTSVEDYLLVHGVITQNLLGQAIAEYYKVPYADLAAKPPSSEYVLRIPQELAIKNHLVLFDENETHAIIATDNVSRALQTQTTLQQYFPNKKISFAYTTYSQIESTFIHYRKPLETRFAAIIATQTKVAPEIIEEIVSDALTFKASDIHFEPQTTMVIVRFRIDGMLHEAGRIPKEIYENILNRIKVQARMRIDEHFAAQDGAIRFPKDDGFVDMRVSLIPTLDGETIVIRLLAEYVKGFTFADLGVSQKNQEIFLKAAKKPFGMILVTGPTGSGKSTTLYSLIKVLNNSSVNITTIEDPVEYKILGINQIQVNAQTDLTFAKGLRSIVRQDPDIMLVGEIRDLETAEIAVNAALTGHLLFSTFHANDAATAIPRLLDMGIEPFMMASSLELLIAQRLIRKICTQCRVSFTASLSEMEKIVPNSKRFFPKNTISLYKGKGCDNCGNTGYKGRTAIYELIPIEEEMQDLILKNPSTQEIQALARKSGSCSLFEDGLDKVNAGVTTINELLRVALPPKT